MRLDLEEEKRLVWTNIFVGIGNGIGVAVGLGILAYVLKMTGFFVGL